MLLEVRNITKSFPIEGGVFRQESDRLLALDDVSFSVEENQTLGIVGESGCGKTTLAKIILGLVVPTKGKIIFNPGKIGNFRKDVQIIFQNPYNSLNPKMRIFDAILEPLAIHGIVQKKYYKDRVISLLKKVELDQSALYRYPQAFSGGQRQRICIARALASEPKFLILDEPISSLDLTIQARLLDLFIGLKNDFKLTYVFISHNLAVIKQISDFVIVMKNGRIVEQNSSQVIFSNPENEYTRLLLASAKRKLIP